MRGNRFWLLLCTMLMTLQLSGAGFSQTRKMNVTSGPERVFHREVGEIIPQLNAASATNENGRVGNELVFWGYELNNNKTFLYGCAMIEGVDCESRVQAICPAGRTEVLVNRVESGRVREFNCTSIGFAAVGELYPGCTDEENSLDLMAGMVQCQ